MASEIPRMTPSDSENMDITWLRMHDSATPRPWARVRVHKHTGSAPADFYLLLANDGSRMLVEKRYTRGSLEDPRKESKFARELSTARQLAILRFLPASEVEPQPDGSFRDRPQGVQLFSDFAPGGSLSEWVETAARAASMPSGDRILRFGEIPVKDDTVRYPQCAGSAASASDCPGFIAYQSFRSSGHRCKPTHFLLLLVSPVPLPAAGPPDHAPSAAGPTHHALVGVVS